MEQQTSTYDLLARIEQGDEYAFTALFEKYQKRLALLIHYKLGHEMRRLADVEDVLQETFLEAFRDIKRFRYEKHSLDHRHGRGKPAPTPNRVGQLILKDHKLRAKLKSRGGRGIETAR
jgi:hypothetical protein